MPKEARCVLNFINDDGRWIALKEALRLLLGLPGFGGEIKQYERIIRKQMSESGGLACLPSAG